MNYIIKEGGLYIFGEYKENKKRIYTTPQNLTTIITNIITINITIIIKLLLGPRIRRI